MQVVIISFFFLFGIALTATAEIKSSSKNLKSLLEREAKSSEASSEPSEHVRKSSDQNLETEHKSRIVFMGPQKGWGFIKQTAVYYSPQGKNLGTLPAGTLFTYEAVKATSKNPMLLSMVQQNNAWQGPYLLDCTTTAAYDGSPDMIHRDVVSNLKTFFTLSGQIAARKEALKESVLSQNPLAIEARETLRKYQQSIEKASALEKESRTLTGLKKIKVDDELRALKYEQVRMKAKLDSAVAAYADWEKANPAITHKMEKDSVLQALVTQREAVRAKVANLIPTDTP